MTNDECPTNDQGIPKVELPNAIADGVVTRKAIRHLVFVIPSSLVGH